jgi:hypothetical protein
VARRARYLLTGVSAPRNPGGRGGERPDGIEGTAVGESMGERYDRDVRALLPLAEATGIEASADLVRAAGFADVTVTPLPEILDLDHRHGVADGHEVRLQYLITGRAG